MELFGITKIIELELIIILRCMNQNSFVGPKATLHLFQIKVLSLEFHICLLPFPFFTF